MGGAEHSPPQDCGRDHPAKQAWDGNMIERVVRRHFFLRHRNNPVRAQDRLHPFGERLVLAREKRLNRNRMMAELIFA